MIKLQILFEHGHFWLSYKYYLDTNTSS